MPQVWRMVAGLRRVLKTADNSLVPRSSNWRLLQACAKVTILQRGFKATVALAQNPSGYKQENPVSKHDSVSKRKRRPKSDKRMDYPARTMAIIGSSEVG
jgi:hypothetical protein